MLDNAQEIFQEKPCNATAGDYLREAITYWRDDMISDETFHDHVARVMRYLVAGHA